MNIDYAILSTNEKPLYFDFWEVVKPVWINHIKIKPLLINICNVDRVQDYGTHIIHNIKSVEGVDTGFQSQISRMWITKFYSNSTLLISDIDMLPMNESYFKDSISGVPENNLVIYSADAYPKNKNRYPMCYNAAKGSTFTEILNLNQYESFEVFCKKMLERKEGWSTDELFFGEKINNFFDQSRITKLERGWETGIANKRIDRLVWTYDIGKLDEYIDSHLVRPYSTYKGKIDKLIEDLLK